MGARRSEQGGVAVSALGWVAFFFTLMLMVSIHELGHYLTAKRFGMKVEAYFLGFGPKIWSRHRGETEFGIRAFPLGGYVKIAGMNPFVTVPPEDADRVFGAKPAWQRAVVLSAGSFTHFVLAVVALSMMFAMLGVPETTTQIAQVSERVEEQPGPAFAAGFQEGDSIIAVDGRSVKSWDQVRSTISSRPGIPVRVTVLRGSTQLDIEVTPAEVTVGGTGQESQTIGLIGVLPEIAYEPLPVHTSILRGFTVTGGLIRESVLGIGRVFSPEGLGRVFSAIGGSGETTADRPIGLVGAGALSGQAAAAGEFDTLIMFLVAFVVFVGVINLVPLPLLDGGYLAILAFEKVRGRAVDMRKVVPVMVMVLGFFIVLFVVVLYLDIVRPVANPFQ